MYKFKYVNNYVVMYYYKCIYREMHLQIYQATNLKHRKSIYNLLDIILNRNYVLIDGL